MLWSRSLQSSLGRRVAWPHNAVGDTAPPREYRVYLGDRGACCTWLVRGRLGATMREAFSGVEAFRAAGASLLAGGVHGTGGGGGMTKRTSGGGGTTKRTAVGVGVGVVVVVA